MGRFRAPAALILSTLEKGRGAAVITITRTRRGVRIAGIAAIFASVAAIGTAAAQAVDVSECVKLTTPEERLACFEAQVEGARNAPPPATSASASEFGQPKAREPESEPEEVQQIQALVTGLRETVPNSFVITLDNGQIWRQTVPKTYPLREGSPVRIYYSRWRTYRLTNDQLKGFIQVERVR